MSKYNNGVRDYILDNVDIVDLISSGVKLEKAGSVMKGLCPFHNEKTPSFVVSNERASYHCFGCNVHGNAIDYVMETENLSFIEALEYLADKYHLDLSFYIEEKKSSNNISYEKNYEMNLESAKFFKKQLSNTPSAKKYFLDRGLKEKTINIFGLGYAPDSWDSLIKHLKSKGYTDLEIKTSGLSSQSSSGILMDRFRNRLIFPIIDYRNRILGFGARTIGVDEPKYLNSPDSPVFKKSEILYGDRLSRKAKRQDGVILVEGYMDMIQVYQHGFFHVLASMGTALTESQARKISQRYKLVFFAYDMDKAGRNAIDRSIPVLESNGVEVRIMELDGAKDPDEFLKKFGASIFKKKITNAINVIQYRLKAVKEKFDLSDAQERLDYVEYSMGLISQINQVLEAEVYLQELSLISGISFDTLNLEYKRRSVNPLTNKKTTSKIFSSLPTEDKEKPFIRDPIRAIEIELLKIAVSDKNLALMIDSEVETFYEEDIDELFASLMVYYVGMDYYDSVASSEILDFDISLALEEYVEKKKIKADEDSLNLLFKRRRIALVNNEIRKIDERIEKLMYSDDDLSKTKLRELRKEKSDLMIEAYNKNMSGNK